jgi:hypothetical protein
MAALVDSGIAGALATLFEDEVQGLFNRSTVLAKELQVKDSFSNSINVAVRDQDGQVASTSSYIADGVDVSVYNTDLKEKATWSHAIMSEAFAVSGLALSDARATGNPAALENLFGEEILTAAQRLASNFNKECWKGTGAANTVWGLTQGTNAALRATGTYAGINKSTRAAWAGNELFNGGTQRALSLDLLRGAVREVYTASGEAPNLIVTDPIQWAKLNSLFTTTQRYYTDPSSDGMSKGGLTFRAGASVMMFDDIPVIQDKDCPVDQDGYGQVVLLNTRHIQIQQLPDAVVAGMVPGVPAATMQLRGTPETQLGDGAINGLKVRIQPLSVNGDNFRFQLIMYVQLVCKRPNACAILGDLSSSYAGL